MFRNEMVFRRKSTNIDNFPYQSDLYTIETPLICIRGRIDYSARPDRFLSFPGQYNLRSITKIEHFDWLFTSLYQANTNRFCFSPKLFYEEKGF